MTRLDRAAKLPENLSVSAPTENQPASSAASIPQTSVFAGVTGYHWLVFVIAAAGWLFDCMGQRIFILAREPAMRELLGSTARDADITYWGAWATATMMIGWATGGILFGMMSDKWGRVKTMVATLLAYTAFSGLTGLAHTQYDFLAYRFLGGLGIGGMFGAATTLLAESVPGRVRPLALGAMQALSAFGNITGSLLSNWIHPGQKDFYDGYAGWRVIFFVGALPAALALIIPWLIREPEPWREAKRKALESADSTKKVGSMADLFKHPVWRKHALVGIALGLAGMAGLWGIGFFSPELIHTALKGLPQDVIDTVRGRATALQDVGAFFGMLSFTFVATYLGRRRAFAAAFVLCLVVTIFVFNSLRVESDAYWMLPIMGFAQLSVFGGYSIYFPELFPTRLRGTGISFCYNIVRYLAAAFPLMLGKLNELLLANGVHEPFRKAATILSFIFLLGLVALIWAPETKGKPLPEG
jgi:MFS family permease